MKKSDFNRIKTASKSDNELVYNIFLEEGGSKVPFNQFLVFFNIYCHMNGCSLNTGIKKAKNYFEKTCK